MSKAFRVALLGNPNSGKSSLFNQLTGLRQKVGNYPGVTVDRKTASIVIEDTNIELTDLPGAYSLYGTSQDERIVAEVLTSASKEMPDLVVYVADCNFLEKQMLLLTQIRDLSIPIILALNMTDLAEQNGLKIDAKNLSRKVGLPVVNISARANSGIAQLKEEVLQTLSDYPLYKGKVKDFYIFSQTEKAVAEKIKTILGLDNAYRALLTAHHHRWLTDLTEMQRKEIGDLNQLQEFDSTGLQIRETMQRYDRFTPILKQVITRGAAQNSLTRKLDSILTDRFWGVLIFFSLLFLMFQSISVLAAYPMDWVEGGFAFATDLVDGVMAEGWLKSLLIHGVIEGMGSVLVFIPQIAILFLLLALLEESGYMARAVYLFDDVMQRFGLNGRSMVALISGVACAIPAIMSTRTISNWKERLITILVTPFMSCSARVPVYLILAGVIVSPDARWGIFYVQSMVVMGMYLLGTAGALAAAWVFKKILRSNEYSFLMLELPDYRLPVARNVGLTVWEKVKTFVLEAGRVILVLSVMLWLLASYSFPGMMAEAEQRAETTAAQRQLDDKGRENLIASSRIEASFAGQLGKAIEPVIRPLGFDWKIGIALLTSFAAREVFVSSMGTIYALGEVEEPQAREEVQRSRVYQRLKTEYSFATSLSLLIFYVFAMQCMSTLAVVKRETNSWKWPLLQLLFMTGFAYLASLLTYQLLS